MSHTVHASLIALLQFIALLPTTLATKPWHVQTVNILPTVFGGTSINVLHLFLLLAAPKVSHHTSYSAIIKLYLSIVSEFFHPTSVLQICVLQCIMDNTIINC